MQQLCEAGEAEFLEIMDLVGMASKPMHVRRLQKALQEWVQNPGKSFNASFFFHTVFWQKYRKTCSVKRLSIIASPPRFSQFLAAL